MTSITITPDTTKKRLRFSGDCIAAGEHVGVTVAGFADKIVGGKLRLRVILGKRTIAKFPLVMADLEADPPVIGDQWTNPEGTTDAYCELNLNTVPAQKYLRCGMECWIVLDDVDVPQKYGTGDLFIGQWCKERGEDTPYNLDEYPDIVAGMKEEIEEFRMTVGEAKTAAEGAVAAANTASGAAQTSANAATTAQNAASRSESAANAARNDADAAREDADRAEEQVSAAQDAASAAESSASSAASSAASAAESAETAASSVAEVKNYADEIVAEEKNRAQGNEQRLENEKQDKLGTKQLDAVNSGIDAVKVAQIAQNASAISAERTRAQGVEATKADLVDGKVPSSQLPSYVDDVLEFASASAFPVTGESGKIYIALDTNKQYRWSGTQYVQLGGGGEDTNAVHYYAETKTEAQKTQARANIGAMAADAPIPQVACKLPVKPLPKYLHYLSFDDPYKADAEAWYESLAHDAMGGACSAVRRGGKLFRKYDWTFDRTAESVVRMSAAEGRHASVGMASLGAALTEDEVMSGVYTPKYRALPGMTLDGINDAGVVAEINVDGGPKTSWHGDADDDGIHILAAVRWVLDHGETAQQAAEWLADHIIQPTGEMNFHFMVADATKTYIVENGEAHAVTDDVKVLTNFGVFDTAQAGGGKERYQLLADGEDISAVNWTNAYQRGNDWHSDFDSVEQHLSAIEQWEAQGDTKDAHRGKTTASGKPWWQSVHSTEYDFAAKTMRVAVQESDEWFTFAVGAKAEVAWGDVKDKPETFAPSAHAASHGENGTDPVTIAQSQVTGLAEALDAKRDLDNLHVSIDRWTIDGDPPVGKLFDGDPYWHEEGAFWALNLKDAETGERSGYISSFDPQTATVVTFTGGVTVPVVATHEIIVSDLALVSQLPAVVAPDASATAGQAADAKATCDALVKKADELGEFIPHDVPSGVTLIGQPTHNNYVWIWTCEGGANTFDAMFTSEDDDNLTFIESAEPYRTFTASRKRVLRTGEAATPQELEDAVKPKADRTAFADAYSDSTSTAYAVGDVVDYNGVVYQCVSATTGGAWDASKWEARKLADFFSESNNLLTGTIAAKSVTEYSSTLTYEVGEIVMHDGVAYKCVTAITTAEEWTAAHWTLATNADLAARLEGFKSDGTATDDFVTDLLGKQVANAKVRYKLSTVSSTTMSDRTTNFLQMNGNATLTFPEAIVIDGEKYSRDFLLRVKVTTAGSLTLPADIALAPYSDDFDFTKANDWLIAFTEEGVDANGKAEFYIRAIG